MQYHIFVLLVGLALIASACGSSVVDTTGVPTTTTSTTTTPTPSTTTTSTPATSTVAVYFFLDQPGTSSRSGPYLVPVARQVATSSDVAAATLGELLKGPTDSEATSVPALSTTIPPNTLILGVSVTGGIAVVDLSKEYESGGGSASMVGRLAQVVYTMTALPGIDSVSFYLDGEPATAFSGEGILIEQTVDRSSYTDQVPGILVDIPAYGREPGNPAHITGVAAAFEAVFQVAVTDRDGLILNETFVMTDNGMGWGNFDALITYEVDEPQWGSLIVWENSAKDGGQINVREYPVWLTPGS